MSDMSKIEGSRRHMATEKRTIRFGIIGCGLMGREFASAVARWGHLTTSPAQPQVVAICNRSDKPFEWFGANFPTISQVTHDYRQVLSNPEVDAVYVALPHDLHEAVYIDAIRAGKHLMGEKPFGIDLAANRAILRAMADHPNVFVRCVSQFPFFPAVQRIGQLIESGALGRIIEVRSAFLHSSDLDPLKPINWKRQAAHCGAYGVMGDLGMHACHVPFRAGWQPRNVRAILSKIVARRPDARGEMVPCDTWDNATLLVETEDRAAATRFPWILRTHRIAPGEKNSWNIEIDGTEGAVRFSTRDPKRLEVLAYTRGQEQIWQAIQCGYETPYPTITGGIFEFGFGDAILQMWAAFVHELATGSVPHKFAGCATAQEARLSHQLFTAALHSAAESRTVEIGR